MELSKEKQNKARVTILERLAIKGTRKANWMQRHYMANREVVVVMYVSLFALSLESYELQRFSSVQISWSFHKQAC